MRNLFRLILVTVFLSTIEIQATQDLRVVPELDLKRYAGTWYEIARLPNRFQKMCAGDVTATYVILENNNITVVNSCRKANGEWETAEGIARLADESGPNSKLEVRFAPAFLSFLPFVWGDYWVIELAPDYTYAVVGSPGRDYLWILSREPQMEVSLYEQLLESVEKQGYDPRDLVRTSHFTD
jgi:apolipoprotein D and lipocalin family protein